MTTVHDVLALLPWIAIALAAITGTVLAFTGRGVK